MAPPSFTPRGGLERPAHGRWPSAGTTVVGVIGDPLAHSLSPLLHNTAFAAAGLDWVSVAFPVRAGATASALGALRDLGVAGLSVTMPHKSAMADLVDRTDPVAARLQAVNCCVAAQGQVLGVNTDGQGFLESLARQCGFVPGGSTCLVVGAGGAARAVVLALAQAQAAEVAVVARDPDRAAVAAALAGPVGRVAQAAEAPHFDLVVEATPVGMAASPHEHQASLVDPEILGPSQVVADLVYHPRVTPFLAAAASRGATTVGGLGMLVHQAAVQLALWTGTNPPVESMWEAAEAAG